MTNQTTFSILNQAIATSQELLTTFAFGDEYRLNRALIAQIEQIEQIFADWYE